jgi:hypothetical protein
MVDLWSLRHLYYHHASHIYTVFFMPAFSFYYEKVYSHSPYDVISCTVPFSGTSQHYWFSRCRHLFPFMWPDCTTQFRSIHIGERISISYWENVTIVVTHMDLFFLMVSEPTNPLKPSGNCNLLYGLKLSIKLFCPNSAFDSYNCYNKQRLYLCTIFTDSTHRF